MEKRQYGEYTTMETRADSHDAVDKQRRYKQIIEILTGKKDGLTAKEIACAMMMKGYIPTSERNYTAPRLTELSQNGVVEPIGKKVCRFTGKKVAVYALREEVDG